MPDRYAMYEETNLGTDFKPATHYQAMLPGTSNMLCSELGSRGRSSNGIKYHQVLVVAHNSGTIKFEQSEMQHQWHLVPLEQATNKETDKRTIQNSKKSFYN